MNENARERQWHGDNVNVFSSGSAAHICSHNFDAWEKVRKSEQKRLEIARTAIAKTKTPKKFIRIEKVQRKKNDDRTVKKKVQT